MTATAPDIRSLNPLLRQAIDTLPDPERTDVARAAVMTEMGYKDMEICRQLGIKWRGLARIRARMQAGVVQALREDGYLDSEIARYLGVDPELVDELHVHEATCLRRISGEWNASCTCGAKP